jgi:DNA-binding Lrp family transcriptional regulator
MIDAAALGGAFTLAALRVPSHDFERTAAMVNAHPEVAHNYRREHAYNMWFVVAAERPERIGAVLAEIERETGYRAIDLPKQREYYLRLKLDAEAVR